MKGGGRGDHHQAGKGPPSTDLLVCFPSRAHLTLMPKPICSPARPSDSTKRHHLSHLKKSGGGQNSPLLWAKTKPISNKDITSEPTSPKVTCAGQIKVRSKPSATSSSSCKNWQSVMEEIERLHKNRKKQKKKSAWINEAFGLKKDVMQFLTCLRNIRFDFRCFGSFPTSSVITSDDDDEDDEDEEEEDNEENENSRTVFSKWFMVLQENNNNKKEKEISHLEESGAPPPPPNALLLMRCRSAPAKSWLQERVQVEEEEEEDEEEETNIKDELFEEKKSKELAIIEEEIQKKRKEKLIVMRCAGGTDDFYKFSSDIAKETWVVGSGVKDPLSRSRSWKR
ncbi:hypothetical protein M9H77_31981 [Catharanthus roseus]|uniref:Uncharacterized protein n=1 Tax=Catharanthus roseus TaxID=4058 RepID=A0ACC0A3P2_CATRO|nr:hypothetical protein M9H77_31981 [Catharanthus roseus]